jgi:hypothetical protein
MAASRLVKMGRSQGYLLSPWIEWIVVHDPVKIDRELLPLDPACSAVRWLKCLLEELTSHAKQQYSSGDPQCQLLEICARPFQNDGGEQQSFGFHKELFLIM